MFKTFFSEYRIAVGHHGFYWYSKKQKAAAKAQRAKRRAIKKAEELGDDPVSDEDDDDDDDDQAQPPEMYKTRQQFVQQRSTKWGMITKLLLALLNAENDEQLPTVIDSTIRFHNDVDPEEKLRDELDDWAQLYEQELEGGERLYEPIEDWPLTPCDPPEAELTKPKVIIYVEYVKTLDHLIRVSNLLSVVILQFTNSDQGLELSGILCIPGTGTSFYCNGSLWKRDAGIDAFMRENKYRVLLLSSVGNAGLNLHTARFMIFAVRIYLTLTCTVGLKQRF